MRKYSLKELIFWLTLWGISMIVICACFRLRGDRLGLAIWIGGTLAAMMLFGAKTALAYSMIFAFVNYIILLPFANIRSNPRAYTPGAWWIWSAFMLTVIGAGIWTFAVLADWAIKRCARVTRAHSSRSGTAKDST